MWFIIFKIQKTKQTKNKKKHHIKNLCITTNSIATGNNISDFIGLQLRG